MKIAISGKGGVGKTTVMALLANQFKQKGKEVLIIDADPSPHMAQTIGIKNTDKIRWHKQLYPFMDNLRSKRENLY